MCEEGVKWETLMLGLWFPLEGFTARLGGGGDYQDVGKGCK